MEDIRVEQGKLEKERRDIELRGELIRIQQQREDAEAALNLVTMKNNANDREALDNSSENKKHMAEHIFTDSERKAAAIAVRDLKSRLKGYLLLAVCEIASTSSLDTSSEVSKPVQIDCRANSKIPLVLDRISQSKSSHMQLLDLVD